MGFDRKVLLILVHQQALTLVLIILGKKICPVINVIIYLVNEIDSSFSSCDKKGGIMRNREYMIMRGNSFSICKS